MGSEDRNVDMHDGIESDLSSKFGELIKAQYDKVDEMLSAFPPLKASWFVSK